jgi:hypothetical protein
VKTGINHPGRDDIIQSMETDWRKIVNNITGPPPDGASVWYQKHMCHHIHDEVELNWISNLQHCFLIRDPREVILSYSQTFEISDARMLGYHKQVELFKRLMEESRTVPPVLDAKDILDNPKGVLSALCDRLGIPFMHEMLSWPAGKRDSDGVWAEYWYTVVEASTKFSPYREREGTLTDDQKAIYDAVIPLYEQLFNYRITGETHHVSS